MTKQILGHLTFLIELHLFPSEKPIMFSGLHILINGNSDDKAILTARAVFPAPTGPKKRRYRRK